MTVLQMQRHLYPNSMIILEIKVKSDWNARKYAWRKGRGLNWGGGGGGGSLLQNLTSKGEGRIRLGDLIERGAK